MLHDAVTAFLDKVKNVKTADELEEKAAQHIAGIAPDTVYVHAVEQLIASAYLLGALHADDGAPGVSAADEADGIPRVSFSQAQTFLQSKVPMTKTEWEALEPKLRFRAFTVAVLGNADAIESVKQKLAGTLKDGGGYAEFLKEIQHTLDTDSLGVRAGYWETVFRTNTQSAYVAGKLEQAEKNGAKAYQLMVIDDGRTTHICRHLLRESGYGMTLPADHPFWKKYGFPPYHFNCRTSVRPVYQSQLAKGEQNTVDNPGMERFRTFKVANGFGGNPLDRGNWWMMTQSQMEQAIKYHVLHMFNRTENVFADYDSVWRGYTRHKGKNGGWYDLCKTPPNDWQTDNKPVVEFLAEHGYKIKVLPEILNTQKNYSIKWSNPDIILNGILTDIKTVDTSITSRLKSVKKQKLHNAVLYIPDTFSLEEITAAFDSWSHGTINLLWIYKGEIHERKLQ